MLLGTLTQGYFNTFPVDIYLFKVNNRNIEQGVKYVQS